MIMASRMFTGDQISALVTLFSKLRKTGTSGKIRPRSPLFRGILYQEFTGMASP